MSSYTSVTLGKYQLTEAFIFTGFLAFFVSGFLLLSQTDTNQMVAAVQQAAFCDWDTTTPATTPHPQAANLIQNGSVQNLSSQLSTPPNWHINSWGDNDSVFDYVTTSGYTDNTSLRVDIQHYRSGDAKWEYSQAIIATPLSAYLFSVDYLSNVETQAVVEITLADNAKQYVNLGLLPPSSQWRQASFVFSAPLQAQSLNVFQVLYQKGYLQTDDYYLAPYQPEPLPQAMVSVTFDDGAELIYRHALPLLQKYATPSTQYVVTSPLIKPYNNYYLRADELKSFFAQGHEIASHSQSHPSLPDLSFNQMRREILSSQYDLYRILGRPVASFASPYGRYNGQVIDQVRQYYCSHRSTDAGYNSPDYFDLYNIRVKNVEVDTLPETIFSWIDYAQEYRVWLVLVFHEIEAQGGKYSYSPQNLEKVLQYIRQSDVQPLTVSQAIPIMLNAQKHQSGP